jgi:hypothetical protein
MAPRRKELLLQVCSSLVLSSTIATLGEHKGRSLGEFAGGDDGGDRSSFLVEVCDG